MPVGAPLNHLPRCEQNPELSLIELAVLDELTYGYTNKEVAYRLTISDQTVKNHIGSIFRKLGFYDRVSCVVFALKHGIVDFPVYD